MHLVLITCAGNHRHLSTITLDILHSLREGILQPTRGMLRMAVVQTKVVQAIPRLDDWFLEM